MYHTLLDAGFFQRKHLLARTHDSQHIADIVGFFHIDHIPFAALRDLAAQIYKRVDQLFEIVRHILRLQYELQIIAFFGIAHRADTHKNAAQIGFFAAFAAYNTAIDAVRNIIVTLTYQKDPCFAQNLLAAVVRIDGQAVSVLLSGLRLADSLSFADFQLCFDAKVVLQQLFVMSGYRGISGGDNNLELAKACKPDAARHAQKS